MHIISYILFIPFLIFLIGFSLFIPIMGLPYLFILFSCLAWSWYDGSFYEVLAGISIPCGSFTLLLLMPVIFCFIGDYIDEQKKKENVLKQSNIDHNTKS